MVRVLRGGNISNGSWCMKSDDVMISSEFVKEDLYLRKGYFITPAVTSWENMGKTALVRENYDNVVVGGFVLMMCPFYTDGIVEEYLNYFFQRCSSNIVKALLINPGRHFITSRAISFCNFLFQSHQ